ncbi:MAG: segregation/condensation protein A [candidate division Zixibacteria bacterium]|nr:segregation/condensation protein A [candidate division Zixibacteria bacterium]
MQETINETAPESYRVQLDVFNGPLDLLLYLIRQEEVDIYDIPIAKITRQYLKYIGVMQTLNLEVAGEFILMAATLIRIKAKLLLPRDENDPEEPDPREELILALVEYKRYKEASEHLRDRALREEQFYVPPSPVSNLPMKIDLSPATTLFDLLSAYRTVLSIRRQELFHRVQPEESSMEERMAVILGRLSDDEMATYRQLCSDDPKRMIAVVTFIAVLELARLRRISVQQSWPFAEMRVYRGQRFTDDTPLDETVEYAGAGAVEGETI